MTQIWRKILLDLGAICDKNNFHFQSFVAEAELVKHSTCLIPLANTSMITCQGIDTERFLQGQLTSDVATVNDHHSQLTAYCTHKGRILMVAFLLSYNHQYFLSIPNDILESTLVELRKFGMFSKVQLNDVSNEYLQMIIIGQHANSVMMDLGLTIENTTWQSSYVNELHLTRLPNQMPCYLIIGKINKIQEILLKYRVRYPLVGDQAWELVKILSGLPTIHFNTKELFTPHEINLPTLDAVSFTKGCYRGQEIIARMQHLGKQKHAMYHGTVSTIIDTLELGSDIIDDQNNKVGKLVSYAVANTKEYMTLVSLKDFMAEKKYFLEAGDKILPIQISNSKN